MVKKLIKHELFYYMRTLLPIYVLLFAVSLMGRLIAIAENDSEFYSIIQFVSGSIFFMFVSSMFTFNYIWIAFRYFKNMFSGEGYLTLTLPISPKQHILVKFLVAFITLLMSSVASLIAFSIYTMGDWFVELIKAGIYLMKNFSKDLTWHLPVFIVQALLIAITSLIFQVFLIYMCISIGQCAKKNRILASVGIYFAFYTAYQVVATFVSMLFQFGYFFMLDYYFEKMKQTTIFIITHSALAVVNIVLAVLILIFYLISKKILTHKVNLE